MTRALLLTGPPGIGKTTALRRIAATLARAGRRIAGFFTAEVRDAAGKRRGFRIETFDGRSAMLARVSFPSPARVGKYGVDLAALDAIVEAALSPAATRDANAVLIDEIGKMECLSPRFVAAVGTLLDAEGPPLIATVSLRGGGFVERVKRRPDAVVITLSRANRDRVPEDALAWLGAR